MSTITTYGVPLRRRLMRDDVRPVVLEIAGVGQVCGTYRIEGEVVVVRYRGAERRVPLTRAGAAPVLARLALGMMQREPE